MTKTPTSKIELGARVVCGCWNITAHATLSFLIPLGQSDWSTGKSPLLGTVGPAALSIMRSVLEYQMRLNHGEGSFSQEIPQIRDGVIQMNTLPLHRRYESVSNSHRFQIRRFAVSTTERLRAMQTMMMLLVTGIIGVAAEIPSDHLSQFEIIKWGFLFGGIGFIGISAIFGVKGGAQQIAQQALAAIPTAGLITPITSQIIVTLFGNALGVEMNLTLLAAVALITGFAGPYLIRKYAIKGLDQVGDAGMRKIKEATEPKQPVIPD